MVDHGDINEVRLAGRIPAAPLAREMPSGDTVWTFRLVVRRPGGRGQRAGAVDTLDCAAYTAAAVRSVRAWREGDEVEVDGVLRRRFWRSATGARSRYEVEVGRGRKVGRPRSG